MRLETLLAGQALRNPDKTCLVLGSLRVSYGELMEACHALAVGFSRWQVSPGDRVLVYMRNGVELVQTFYATYMVGGLVVPVNTRLTLRELEYFLKDSQPSVVVLDADNVEAVDLVASRFPTAKLLLVGAKARGEARGRDFAELAEPTDEALPEVPLSAEDCMILYTSGTTGKPKGAIVTHANFIIPHCFMNAIEWGISHQDCYLVTTPLAHRTGLARLANSLCLGGTLVLMESFDAQEAIRLIEQEKVTAAGMVPTVARMLMPYLEQAPERCSSLRHIIVTGEAFPVELKKKLMALLPHAQLHSFFAMTEVGSVTCLDHSEQLTHAASVGRPTIGVEVKLVGETGKPVSVEEVGEILVRSGAPGRFTTMRGYYNRPQETAEAVVDGWIRTGDMGRLDIDGYLYIVDRKKDMVLSGGFNIYTKEVEMVLHEHPAVREASVVGVPDAVFGEAVAAFVELRDGQVLSDKELIEYVKKRIASYKKPKYVFFVDALPRTAVGKVVKSELRLLAESRSEAVS